jgi:phosphoribosylglycinamide formyltransferase 2
MSHTILLLGSGELGKEFAIAAQGLGLKVVAVDRYYGAPAMAVAHEFEVINMLDGDELDRIVEKHRPQFIVPEIEAIRTEKLLDIEQRGFKVVPTARAAHLTMNRDAIRNLAADELKLRTARFAYASDAETMTKLCNEMGFPCVVKPVMSSSGKGQSIVNSKNEVLAAWDKACSGMRGDQKKVIVEEFIKFETEITLLTVKQNNGPTIFVEPIGHRQEEGDYRESWMPAAVRPPLLEEAKRMAKKITDNLGGAGIYGVEFFLTKSEVIFSELSPRPHDTGLVTLVSQDISEFELHLRAIMGLPIPPIQYVPGAASAVILATQDGDNYEFHGIDKALADGGVKLRLFGKPNTRPGRRMGVALATHSHVIKARQMAKKAAESIKITYS